MKVLIPTMGTRGDIQPYIYLARALNASGLETTIASHPCWRELVGRYGVNFHPIGPDIDIQREAAVIRSNSRHWLLGTIKTMKFMFRIIEESVSELKALSAGVDLVIASHSHIGAAEAEANGVPFISVTLQPTAIPKRSEQGTIRALVGTALGAVISPFIVRPYNKLRKKLGLKPVWSFDELLSPYLNIIPISPQVCPPEASWDERHKVVGYWFLSEAEDFAAPECLLDFIHAGPAPVVISLGAMGFEGEEEREKLDILVNSISKTGMRAVLQGFHKTLENYQLPDNVMSIGSVPHDWLFRQAYCVIHHGGFGTTAAALRSGVPSIVIPHVLDQHFWAEKVQELGVGTTPVKSKDLSERELVDRLQVVRDEYDRMRANAGALRRRLEAEDGLARAVALIQDVVESK